MSITFFIFFTFSSRGYFHCFFAILSAMILSMMVDDIDQLTSLQSSKFFVRHTALSWFSSSASSFMSLPSSAPSIILSSSSAERKFSVFPSSTHVTLPCQLLCFFMLYKIVALCSGKRISQPVKKSIDFENCFQHSSNADRFGLISVINTSIYFFIPIIVHT